MCIENESTGKYTCSRAPYTRFTSVSLQDLALHLNADSANVARSIRYMDIKHVLYDCRGKVYRLAKQ